jgi:hypothetical protein
MVSWIQAILRPQAHLAFPHRDIFEFHITAIVILYQIWFTRNQLIHKNITPNIHKKLKLISNIDRAHIFARKNSHQGNNCWQPPPSGAVKVNFDIVIHPSFAVAVAVLSYSNGSIILDINKKTPSLGCDYITYKKKNREGLCSFVGRESPLYGGQ